VGFYRFILAIGVVFFHVGGGNWVIGRVAVYCFYFVSGFLICRVLDTSYRGGVDRLAAFYSNRLLRLMPLYVVIAVLTIVVFGLHGSTSFLRGDGETVTLLPERFLADPFANFEDLLPLPYVNGAAPIPMLTGRGPDVIPQAWSIGVEILFYLIAPILVLLARRHVWPLAAVAVLATVAFLAASIPAPDFNYVDNVIYKNAFTSAFMFLWGAVIYVLLRDSTFRIPFVVAVPIVAIGLYYFYAWSASELLGPRGPSRDVFIVNTLLAIPLSAVVCLTVVPAALRRWESRLGDLSYGIYLNHFLVAGLLLWLSEAVGWELFGRYDRAAFGVYAILACALFAALTFNLVERPIEILRRKIKRRPDPHAVAASDEAPSVAAPAA